MANWGVGVMVKKPEGDEVEQKKHKTKGMSGVHFNLATMRPVCIWNADTHGWIISQAKSKLNLLYRAKANASKTYACVYLFMCVCLEKVGSVPPSHVSHSSWRSNHNSVAGWPMWHVVAVLLLLLLLLCCLHQSSNKAQARPEASWAAGQQLNTHCANLGQTYSSQLEQTRDVNATSESSFTTNIQLAKERIELPI